MPKQRRLDAEATEEAVKLLAPRANKKLVQNHLINLTSKTVTRRTFTTSQGRQYQLLGMISRNYM